MSKEEFKKQEFKDNVFLLITFLLGSIFTFYFNFISIDNGDEKFARLFQICSYGWIVLIVLLAFGLKKELKKSKVITYLILLDLLASIALSVVTFNIQTDLLTTLKVNEIVSTNTYKVEDIKVDREQHSFYSETIYEVTYEKNGKLKTINLSEEEGKEYKDYNRHKPSYKLEVTEYSYTKEFKKKYPNFKGRTSKQKLILERSGD